MKRVVGYWFLSLLIAFLAACQTEEFETNTGQNSVRASVQASATEGVAPLVVTFDASASQGNIAVFSWVFGDGAQGQGERVSHTFTRAGVFNVRLTVEDSNGNEDNKTVTITVRDSAGNPNPNPNPNPKPTTVPVSAGVVLPLRRAELERGLSELGVDAVYFASQQSGTNALVTTGTATQASNGSFSYSPEPTDRLRVVFNDGLRLEYLITTLEGDFSEPNGREFLREDHSFVYRLISSEGTDANITLNQVNDVYSNTVKGQIVEAGITYSVDTTTQGQVITDVDPPGAEFESLERVAGTITTEGFSVTLDETFRYHVFIFENAIEDIQKDINNTWTIGSDQYALTNASIFRTFKNAFPDELDSWNATGQLTRNGQVIGGLSFEETIASVDTVLTADGEKTVLFSDSKVNP
jgi:PKD repeat protein